MNRLQSFLLSILGLVTFILLCLIADSVVPSQNVVSRVFITLSCLVVCICIVWLHYIVVKGKNNG